MTLTLELKPETEKEILKLSANQGIQMSEVVESLLEKALLRERNAATIAVLNGFMEGDGDEQRETWLVLEKGMLESRQASRRATD